MAQSIHYILSDRVDNGVVKKSVRALVNVMKDAPVDFPDEELSPAEFQGIVNHIEKRGVKRQFNAISPIRTQKTPRWSHSIPEKSRRAGTTLTRPSCVVTLEDYEESRYKNWMFKMIAEYLTEETGEAFSKKQKRYRLRGRLIACENVWVSPIVSVKKALLVLFFCCGYQIPGFLVLATITHHVMLCSVHSIKALQHNSGTVR